MLEVIRALIDHDARINAPGREGFTPLHAACYSAYCPTIVDYLISKGANVSARDLSGDTPLHIVAYTGNGLESAEQIVQILLAHGADVNAINIRRETPLDFAVDQRWRNGATLLKERGAASGKNLNVQRIRLGEPATRPSDLTRTAETQPVEDLLTGPYSLDLLNMPFTGATLTKWEYYDEVKKIPASVRTFDTEWKQHGEWIVWFRNGRLCFQNIVCTRQVSSVRVMVRRRAEADSAAIRRGASAWSLDLVGTRW